MRSLSLCYNSKHVHFQTTQINYRQTKIVKAHWLRILATLLEVALCELAPSNRRQDFGSQAEVFVRFQKRLPVVDIGH